MDSEWLAIIGENPDTRPVTAACQILPRPGEAMAIIYGLADPRDHAVRYVGKTNRSPSERLWEHEFKPSNQRVAEWLRTLRADGVEAEVLVLETCAKKAWQEREIYWIKRYRGEKRGLLNIAKGGVYYGPSGKSASYEAGRAFHRKAIARSGPVRIYTPKEIAEFSKRRLASR